MSNSASVEYLALGSLLTSTTTFDRSGETSKVTYRPGGPTASSAEPVRVNQRNWRSRVSPAAYGDRIGIRRPERRRPPGSLEHGRHDRDRLVREPQRRNLERLRHDPVLDRPDQMAVGKDAASAARLDQRALGRIEPPGVDAIRLRVVGAHEEQESPAGKQLWPAVIVVAALGVERGRNLRRGSRRVRPVETGRPADREQDRPVLSHEPVTNGSGGAASGSVQRRSILPVLAFTFINARFTAITTWRLSGDQNGNEDTASVPSTGRGRLMSSDRIQSTRLPVASLVTKAS